MDLSIILSIIAIVISVFMSTITLLLTEFRGPNISLLNVPDFEVNDESFAKTPLQDYTPRRFHLKSIPFVFANHGGKSGTVLDLEFRFVPHNSFKMFFDMFYANITIYEGGLSPPVTIEKGDNEYLMISPEICTIDWKETSLAEVLDLSLKVDDIVAKALEKSKEKFESFCDFLDKSQELGEVSCTVTLTKGRFRTKVAEEKLFKTITIANHYDEALSSLRKCLHRWENLKPTKAELLNKMRRDLEGLIRESKGNLEILERAVGEQSISGASKLRVDNWNQLQRIRTLHDRKIRWFLIKCEEGLEKDLTKLYRKILKYNSSVDELMFLGELRTQKQFTSINAEREELRPDAEKMCKRLSELYRRSIS